MRTLQQNVLHAELSYQLMQIAFAVHNQLGPGFTENIYEEAMVYELAQRKIPFEQQKVIQVSYKNRPVGIYRLDLVIDNKIILELKAVEHITELFGAQLRSYLKATGLDLGIIINFGNVSVTQKRVVYTPYEKVDPIRP